MLTGCHTLLRRQPLTLTFKKSYQQLKFPTQQRRVSINNYTGVEFLSFLERTWIIISTQFMGKYKLNKNYKKITMDVKVL